MIKETLLDIFFDTLTNCITSITLPTGDTLTPTFLYALLITVLSGIARVFHLFPLVDWRGALLATVLLAILALIERRAVSEVSRLYRAVKSGAASLKKRAESAGAALKNDRAANTDTPVSEQD